MAYKVSTSEKKNVTEVESWYKDGQYLKHKIGWRWGTVIVEDKPDLSEYDPENETIEVYDEWGAQMESCDDGCWEEWEYPNTWEDDDIEKFQEAWDEQWHDAPTSMGFEEQDSELWFTGPLEVEEIESDKEEDEDA